MEVFLKQEWKSIQNGDKVWEVYHDENENLKFWYKNLCKIVVKKMWSKFVAINEILVKETF